ncbi:MAG: alpha-amylase family glycosyl hydrolase [Promethearchaeota archaeon]
MLDSTLQWPNHPKIYEINTWPWLNYLSDTFNTPIILQTIPEEIFNREISLFDAIWLMGVWERSPASKKIALEHPDLQDEYHKALHEFREKDVVGSPFAVYYYHVDKNLGGLEGLQQVRQELFKRNIKLILDYVPNHVSIDSLWTLESNLFIEGTLEDLMSHPYQFFSQAEKIYAHGRDPNFPAGWTDTIQINAFSPDARQKTINTLLNIAELCDGVRCDMAMLMCNKIFSKTWGDKAGPAPDKEFWEEIISSVKKKFPNFKFIAEVYWNMEWELQNQGFDFCYDKRLYERLIHENVDFIKEHLKGDFSYQNKLVRFIENHDEKRAVVTYGAEKSRAAALIALTIPGARLIHEGQMKGFKLRLPVQLGRRQSEDIDQNLQKYYLNLLKVIPGKEFSDASWLMCRVEPLDFSDSSFKNIISYLWWIDKRYLLIIVNFSPNLSKAHIRIDNINFGYDKWKFIDLLNEKDYQYEGKNLVEFGLYVELAAWKGHIFNIQKI